MLVLDRVLKPGTKAWLAQLEVGKLDGVIGDRMKQLQTADPQQAQRLSEEVKYLSDQLKQHRRTFERMDESTGVGYVAAKGKYTDEQIQQITSNLKIGDEVKRPDSRGRITKIENGNVTMELTMTRGRGKGQTMTVTTPISQYGNGWELTKPPRKRKNPAPEDESRTRHYQFGEQKHTRVSEDVKKYPNAFVRGGGKYDPHVLRTFEEIKNNNNLNDRDIARAMNTLLREGEIPPGMLNRQQEKKLTEITYLIFGRESVRNKRNLVQAPILFSQVAKGRISIFDAVKQLPMSPDGAQSSAKRLDDFDSGTKPYPQEGTKIYERVKEVEQKETKVINDFIADEMKRDGIEQFNDQQELIEYVQRKIKEQLNRSYGTNLNQNN